MYITALSTVEQRIVKMENVILGKFADLNYSVNDIKNRLDVIELEVKSQSNSTQSMLESQHLETIELLSEIKNNIKGLEETLNSSAMKSNDDLKGDYM